MTLKKLLSRCCLYILIYTSVNAAEVKPKYVATTTRLFQSTEFVRNNPAPDFWALMPYYIPQQDGAACGIASMTMLMNAARVHQNLSASDALVTQKSLVEKTKVDYSMGKLTLNKLSETIKKSMTLFGLKGTVEKIHADGSLEQNEKIHALLLKNEKSDRNFILANFLQSEFTGDAEGAVGHISPVAAFDAKNNKILIMDVDREYYEPYWVSFDTFIKGLNTLDKIDNLNRGIVFVEFQ